MSDSKLPKAAPVGEYPYNLVRVWPDGRELHMNYTPGNYTTRYFTNIGTGFEIDKSGRAIQTVVGNNHQYTKGGASLTIEKNNDSKIAGSNRQVSDQGSLSESGNGSYNITKGVSINASSGTSTTASGNGSNSDNIVDGTETKKVNGDVHLLVKGDDVKIIQGNSAQSISGNSGEKISGGYTIIVGSKLIITAQDIEMRAANSFNIYSTTLKHNDVNISYTHRHKDVVPGGALTGLPT